MKLPSTSRVCCLLISFVWLLGCTEKAQQSDPAPEAGKLGVVRLKELPALGEPIPRPLDQGRVRVAPPEQWHIAPQSTRTAFRRLSR